MAPALRSGDRVVAIHRPLAAGVIVVFEAADGMVMVKRVVGLPGDTVTIGHGMVLVNGTPREDVLDTPGEGSWSIGPGECFVLSDARDLTLADSRTFGPIDVSSILGTVAFRYRPLSRMGRPR